VTRVLITGAAGTIGRDLREGLRGRHELLRLLDVAEQEPAGEGEELVTASVADAEAMHAAAADMDAIVHLAANPVDAPFDVILEPNIVGTQRVFEAAVAAGVPRVVYASSHHAAGFWPRSHPMRVTDPVRPDSHYGSANTRGWLVQEDLSWLGWEPRDDAEAYADEVEPEPPGLAQELDGGPYVARLNDPRYD
jgi:uronate dehydrogenase